MAGNDKVPDVEKGARDLGGRLLDAGAALLGPLPFVVNQIVKNTGGGDNAAELKKAVTDGAGKLAAGAAASAASGIRIPGMTPEKAQAAMVEAGNNKLRELGAQVGDAATGVAGAVTGAAGTLTGAIEAGVNAGKQAVGGAVSALKNAVGIVPEELKDTRQHDLSGLDIGEGAGGTAAKGIVLDSSADGTVTATPGAGSVAATAASATAASVPAKSASKLKTDYSKVKDVSIHERALAWMQQNEREKKLDNSGKAFEVGKTDGLKHIIEGARAEGGKLEDPVPKPQGFNLDM